MSLPKTSLSSPNKEVERALPNDGRPWLPASPQIEDAPTGPLPERASRKFEVDFDWFPPNETGMGSAGSSVARPRNSDEPGIVESSETGVIDGTGSNDVDNAFPRLIEGAPTIDEWKEDDTGSVGRPPSGCDKPSLCA